MSEKLPAVLRGALDAPSIWTGIHPDSLRADRARAMAVALRWAAATMQKDANTHGWNYLRGWCAAMNTWAAHHERIAAALEQETA